MASREAAKGNAHGRCSVFGQASRGRESAGGAACVHCMPCRSWSVVVCWCVAPSPPTPLPRFTGARGALCSSGFPARDLPFATGCLEIAAAGRGAAGGLTRSREAAKPRSREAARGDAQGRCSVFGQASRGRESAGGAACVHCMPCRSWSVVVCWGVAPSPPTPLPRFTGARGGMPWHEHEQEHEYEYEYEHEHEYEGGDAKVDLCCGGCWFAKGTFVASL